MHGDLDSVALAVDVRQLRTQGETTVVPLAWAALPGAELDDWPVERTVIWEAEVGVVGAEGRRGRS
jgi:hypothetical protein